MRKCLAEHLAGGSMHVCGKPHGHTGMHQCRKDSSRWSRSGPRPTKAQRRAKGGVRIDLWLSNDQAYFLDRMRAKEGYSRTQTIIALIQAAYIGEIAWKEQMDKFFDHDDDPPLLPR